MKNTNYGKVLNEIVALLSKDRIIEVFELRTNKKILRSNIRN